MYSEYSEMVANAALYQKGAVWRNYSRNHVESAEDVSSTVTRKTREAYKMLLANPVYFGFMSHTMGHKHNAYTEYVGDSICAKDSVNGFMIPCMKPFKTDSSLTMENVTCSIDQQWHVVYYDRPQNADADPRTDVHFLRPPPGYTLSIEDKGMPGTPTGAPNPDYAKAMAGFDEYQPRSGDQVQPLGTDNFAVPSCVDPATTNSGFKSPNPE